MNNKNLLLGIGGLLVVLIGVVVVLLAKQSGNANNATVPAVLSLPGSTPGRASGYKGAELMPAPNGTGGAAGTASMGTAPTAAPATATGYQNSSLMPAPTAVR